MTRNQQKCADGKKYRQEHTARTLAARLIACETNIAKAQAVVDASPSPKALNLLEEELEEQQMIKSDQQDSRSESKRRWIMNTELRRRIKRHALQNSLAN